MGRQEFYDWYRIRIAEVVSERVFMSDNIVESHTADWGFANNASGVVWLSRQPSLAGH